MKKESVTIRFNLVLFILGEVLFFPACIACQVMAWVYKPDDIGIIIMCESMFLVFAFFSALLLILYACLYVKISEDLIYIHYFRKKKRTTIYKDSISDISVLYIPRGRHTNIKYMVSYKDNNIDKSVDIDISGNEEKLYRSLIDFNYKVNGIKQPFIAGAIQINNSNRKIDFQEFDSKNNKKPKIRRHHFNLNIILMASLMIIGIVIIIVLTYKKIAKDPVLIVPIVVFPILFVLFYLIAHFDYVSIDENIIIVNSLFKKTIINRNEIKKVSIFYGKNSNKIQSIFIYKTYNADKNNIPSLSLYITNYDLEYISKLLREYHYIDIDD